MPNDLAGYGYWDESRLRGAQPAGYSAPDYVPDPSTPINTQFTYNNGGTWAGTGSRSNPGGGNVPLSDQALALMQRNGLPLPTDRDVLGGGQFGVRGWLNAHPVGTIAAFIAAAAGGGALAGGAGGGAAGGAGGGFGTAGAAQGAIGSGGAISGLGAGAGAASGTAASGGILGGAGLATNVATAGGGSAGGAGGGSSGGLGNLLGGGNMGWGDWINLAGQLYGSYSEGQGAKDASRAANAGILAGIEEQRRQFDLSRGDQMPWLQSGVSALGRLNDPTAFTTSPGYEFVRGEGQRGIQNSFAARGGALSGNALRALSDYNQNLASQEYNNWFNQQSNLAGLGQTSAQSLGALGQNNANNVSGLLQSQGNNRASGIAGQTNALTGGIADFLAWYNRRNQPSSGGGGDAYGGWT